MQQVGRMTFYKETDFQESPIGKIPMGWQAKATDDLFVVETGTTPSTKQETYWKGGTVNWLTPTDLSRLNGKLRMKGSERKITEKALRETSLTLMPKGSIILSTRAPVGYVAILEDDATFNQGCKGLIPRGTFEILTEFYSYYLSSKKEMLQNLSSGSTFLELSKNRLEKLIMPYLPMLEQKAIVEVLGVVDSAIELADKVIAKTERLKKGSMQKLLTEGIGHKEYKDTPMGKMPKDWNVRKLGEVLELCQYGLSSRFGDQGKYPIVKMDDIVNGVVVPDNVKYLDVNARTFDNFRLERGDVLFNRTNSFELVGRTGIFLLDGDYVFASYLIRLRPKRGTIDSLYLTYYMTFSNERLKQLATRAVHQANINATNLQSFKIPVPPLAEQQRIAETLVCLDSKLELEKKLRAKLKRIKQGLMDLLLTGKIRIRVD
jgi:type I restriction enzyme S subunit